MILSRCIGEVNPYITPFNASPQKEAQELLSTCSCPEYLIKAEKRLNEEIERVQHYLDPSTELKITRCVETELILNQVRLVDFLMYEMKFTWVPVRIRHLCRLYLTFILNVITDEVPSGDGELGSGESASR